MIRFRFSATMFVVGLVVSADAKEEPQAALDRIRQEHKVPGLAVATMREGELVFSGVSGFRQAGSPEPVTRDDLWHIGSCTKSMTGTLAGVLVDEGVIGWDAKVGDILPEFRGKLKKGWEQVTLEMLLTNRAGVPTEPPPDAWREAYSAKGKPSDQRLKFLKAVIAEPLAAAPGTKNIYSNQGLVLAGAMLERAAKQPYEELLKAKVFRPLGMNSSGFGAPGSAKAVDQPRGHRGQGDIFTGVPPGPGADNPEAITPAGRVHCSIGDFVRYASWHARGPLRDVKLMGDATFQRLHAPPAGQAYAMGWVVGERPWADGTVWTHNGSNTMWFAVMWIAPNKQTAYVAVTNAAGDAGSKACDAAVSAMIR